MYSIVESNNKNKVTIPFTGNYNNISFGNICLNDIKVSTSLLLEKDKIIISKNIIKKLCLNLETEYKILKKGNNLEMGPLIGILLGNKTLSYNSSYMEKYLDRFIDFHKINGSVVAFSIDTINYKEKSVQGLVYNPKTNEFAFGKSPLPKFIYRRNFHQGNYAINKLKKYSYLTNHKRITKDYFYKILKDSSVRKYLPLTLELDEKTLKNSLQNEKNLILKPLGLSRGRGMIVVEKKDNMILITNYVEKKEVYLFDKQSALVYLLKLELQNYLIQEYIHLDDYKGLKYDIRVVVQKDVSGEFKISGIEVRLSKAGELLTNYSLGGKIITLKEALINKWDYKLYKKAIEKLSIETSKNIDKHVPSYELGLDVALSNDGKLFLIEANSLPSFKGFKEIEMNTYLTIRKNPLIFGSEILGFKI